MGHLLNTNHNKSQANTIANGAFHFLELAKNKENEGYFFNSYACIAFLAFSIESLVNFIGSKNFSDWNDTDKLETKIELVCKEKNLNLNSNDELNRGSEPLQSIFEIIKCRNLLAHDKPFNNNENLKDISIEKLIKLYNDHQKFYNNLVEGYDAFYDLAKI